MLSLWLACAASDAYFCAVNGAAVDRRRDQLVGRPEVGVLLHLFGDLHAGLGHDVAEAVQPRAGDGRVVQLGRDATLRNGRVRDPVGLDVVGMPVEAVLVVGDDDLRLEGAHQRGQPAPRHGHRCPPEAVGRVVLRPALHARVVVAEQLQVRDAQDLATGLELLAAQRHHHRLVVPRLAGLDPAGRVPELAVGARDQHGAHPLGAVTGEDPARADRFVVGMGVDRHEGERALGHCRQRRGRRGRPRHVCRSPTASANCSSSRRPLLGRRHRAHDELGEPDLEEPLEHGAQAAAPDRDDLFQRATAGPPGQRRRRQRADVGPFGRVGQADPEVLRADGASVCRGHLVDHGLARRGVARRAEGREPSVGQATAPVERGRDVPAEPHVEGILRRLRGDRDVG